jgi:hypothetical protein
LVDRRRRRARHGDLHRQHEPHLHAQLLQYRRHHRRRRQRHADRQPGGGELHRRARRDRLGQTIQGNAGANILNGGAGNDRLDGFGGADAFLFDTALDAATNVDRVADLDVSVDAIWLENAIFTVLTTAGTLDLDAFLINAAAADAEDRIIYNDATGALA